MGAVSEENPVTHLQQWSALEQGRKQGMSPKEKTGLGLGCFNLTGFPYTLIIDPDGSVKLQ
jgi:hypothetical protein